MDHMLRKPWLRSVEELHGYAVRGTWLHTAWVPDGILQRLPWAGAHLDQTREYVVVDDLDVFLTLGVDLGCWTSEDVHHVRELHKARELLALMTDDPDIILGG